MGFSALWSTVVKATFDEQEKESMKNSVIVMALALGLLAGPSLLPAAGEKQSKQGEQSQGDHRTIRGVIAGVTILGETMVDYQQKRAVVAEADYLTIVEEGKHGKMDERSSGDQANRPATRDRDVNQSANADLRTQRESRRPEDSSRNSSSVYLIRVTPTTQVCECDDHGKKKCDLSRLEVGDRVEVEYGSADSASKPEQDIRHGRHHLLRGDAISVSILHNKSEEAREPERHGQGRESKSGSQGSR
jgi:hypothetical protein